MSTKAETPKPNIQSTPWVDWWPASMVYKGLKTDEKTQRDLADQFRRSLFSDLRSIPAPADDAPHLQALYNEAEALLADPHAFWPQIYQAQKHLTHLIPDDAVDPALRREIDEATSLSLTTDRVATRIEAIGSDAAAILEKRKYLSLLIADLQWERKQRRAKSEMRACYVWNVCLLTILVVAIGAWALWWEVTVQYAQFEQLPIAPNLEPGNSEDKKPFTYPGLLVAIASGILGAWFSMLRTIDTRLSGLTLSELRVLQRWVSLVARLIFGAAAATIFYFLLQAGLFKAPILPDIAKIGFQPVAGETMEVTQQSVVKGESNTGGRNWLPSTNFCLLIIWGVICGFSENLIPSALTRHADSVGENKD